MRQTYLRMLVFNTDSCVTGCRVIKCEEIPIFYLEIFGYEPLDRKCNLILKKEILTPSSDFYPT